MSVNDGNELVYIRRERIRAREAIGKRVDGARVSRPQLFGEYVVYAWAQTNPKNRTASEK